MVVKREYHVAENLRKIVSDEMFFANSLLYQRDRLFNLHATSEAAQDKTEYRPLRRANIHVIAGHPKVAEMRLLYVSLKDCEQQVCVMPLLNAHCASHSSMLW